MGTVLSFFPVSGSHGVLLSSEAQFPAPPGFRTLRTNHQLDAGSFPSIVTPNHVVIHAGFLACAGLIGIG